MGSEFRTRIGLALRAATFVVVLSALVPTSADAADLWCWLFGCGSGSGHASEQALPDRGAPEIDPGALAGAIALAAGVAAMLSDRVRRRR